MINNETPKAVHQGRNVKRFREMLGIKQEALADQLGEGWSQRRLSSLEGKEVIDPELLDELAIALKVPAEAIKNFTEETAITIISSTLTDTSIANVNQNPIFNFNPVDKILELANQKEELYKELLKEKDEKIALLQKILGK